MELSLLVLHLAGVLLLPHPLKIVNYIQLKSEKSEDFSIRSMIYHKDSRNIKFEQIPQVQVNLLRR